MPLFSSFGLKDQQIYNFNDYRYEFSDKLIKQIDKVFSLFRVKWKILITLIKNLISLFVNEIIKT